MKNLSELTKLFRYRIDLTQAQLAEKIGVSESTVKHWEAGDKNIGPSGLMRLLHLATDVGDKEFPRAVKAWQSSADAERIEKLRSRAGDIRKPMLALIRNLKASADTAELLAKHAPKAESLASMFDQVAESLRVNVAWMEEVYEPLNNLMQSEKAALRHAR